METGTVKITEKGSWRLGIAEMIGKFCRWKDKI